MTETYTTTELCARTGMSQKQGATWRRVGILPDPIGGRLPGSGSQCRWTDSHVLAATAVRLFIAAGIGGHHAGWSTVPQRQALAHLVHEADVAGVLRCDQWIVVDDAGVRLEDLDGVLVLAKGSSTYSLLRVEELADEAGVQLGRAQ